MAAEEYGASTLAEQLIERTERGTPLEVVQAIHAALHAARLLVLDRICQVRSEYPVTIQSLLAEPGQDLDVSRDALAEPQEVISTADLLDMLSEEALPCIAPRLHRGWLDKKQSCREARRLTASATGVSIEGQEREDLLLGLALSNRVFLYPPPFRLSIEQARQALPPVLQLLRRLASAHGTGAMEQLVGRMLEEDRP